jgi:hypothetical protein
MKFKLLILLAFISLAAAKELPAYPSGSVAFSGCNCKADNEPNPIEISFLVTNPSPLPLTLSYEWYDPNTNSYIQGSGIKCSRYSNVVSPNNVDSCMLTAYTMMGGLNGTSNIKIRLTGADGVDEYTKTFWVEMSYHTSPFENNIVSRMQGINYEFHQTRNAIGKNCYGGSCCGMLDVERYLYLALDNLSSANTSLRACRLSSSWSYLMNASNSTHAANESLISLKSNCSAAVSLINDTGLRIAYVAKVVSEGKKCGSNVTLSELHLSDANNSLEEAAQALVSDDYGVAFSKLKEANSSIYSSVNSIGKCPGSISPEPVVTVVKQNSTNSSSNQTSSGDNTLLILGGAFVGLLILAAAAFAVLSITRTRPRKEEAPKSPPITPPTHPPATPEMHEDLEKEFNEWLESHSQKK